MLCVVVILGQKGQRVKPNLRLVDLHVFGNEEINLSDEYRSYFQFAWAAHAVMLYNVISAQIEGNALE